MKRLLVLLFLLPALLNAANILTYNPASPTVPNRVTGYLRSEDTGKWLATPNVLINPTLPDGVPLNECKVVNGTVVALTESDKTAIAAAEATARQAAIRAAAKDSFDADLANSRLLRAIVAVMVEQINTLRTNPTTAYSAATEAQVRTAIRNKLDAQ
jgi:hypothetical protein